jgi:hypothetical protein
VRRYTSTIPVFGKLRQEDHKLKARLGYMWDLISKKFELVVHG